jgi:hypothetical protein
MAILGKIASGVGAWVVCRAHSSSVKGTIMRTGWLLALSACLTGPAWAVSPVLTSRPDPLQGTASPAARQDAIQAIPFEKLDAAGRTKVSSVLSNITVFRRLPTRVVGCDPDFHLFLVRHPDVVVNIWEVLGLAQLKLRQTGPTTYDVVESEGTKASMEFLYRSQDLHVVYGEWSYTGPILPRTIRGKCLAVLKCGYVRQADGRYYVTNRLDAFLSVEPGAVELLTKTLHPLVVKNADSNFVQTVAFVGSLSRTAEVNSRGMQRLTDKLSHVRPEVREEMAELIGSVAQKAATPRAASGSAAIASRPKDAAER